MGRSKPVQKVFTCGEDIEQNNVQVFFQIQKMLIINQDYQNSQQVTRHFVATRSCDSGMIIDRHTGVRVARYKQDVFHPEPSFGKFCF